jgi:hypothetical protein
MTIIEKELAATSVDLSTNFLAQRNIHLAEIQKMTAFRNTETAKAVQDVKRIAMLTREIDERNANYQKLLITAKETVQYRDRLNGSYEAIIKPHNFVWYPIAALSFWQSTNIRQIYNPFFSKVGTPFRVTTKSVFENILPLPYDQRRLKGTGYLQEMRILDSGGYQSLTDETYLDFSGTEIIVKEMLAGEAYNCFLINAAIPRIAPTGGLYITSITGANVEDLLAPYDQNDPEDEGFDTGIKLNCIAIMNKSNFMYSFKNESFEANGKVLDQFYSWLPDTTYIF